MCLKRVRKVEKVTWLKENVILQFSENKIVLNGQISKMLKKFQKKIN